ISLMTRDIDFLIDRPQTVKKEVDIPELLKDLGFITTFKGRQGYMKLDHPELILEFLTPERGRGRDKPFPLPTLHINATALRFLNFLSENTIKIKVENFTVQLPHPANFGLHKLIISPRRPKAEKAIKDRDAAIIVLKALMDNKQSRNITSTFKSMPRKWQAQVIKTLESAEEAEILQLLDHKTDAGNEKDKEKAFRKAVRKVNNKHKTTLRKLAE
ncbi:MAG: hypothetical protein KC684_07585, partial [Candidatus Omnitrophica bacterium]|nr:hypothetical protein [Candidatus Omnitrophota bacterium]